MVHAQKAVVDRGAGRYPKGWVKKKCFSLPTFIFYFLWEGRLQGWRANIEELGNGWDWGT